MSFIPSVRFQVQEGIFDNNTLRDEVNFFNQRQGSITELTKTITYVLGEHTRKYPIAMMTIGAEGYGDAAHLKNSSVSIPEVQFSYPVMGKMFKASECGTNVYTATDRPGIGNDLFKVRFRDNQIHRYSVIQDENGYQLYIHDEGRDVGNAEFEYTAQLDPADSDDYLPYTALDPGKKWIDFTRNVAESESRTTETGMVMPGQFKNQMSFMRLGTSWAGNAAAKKMKIIMKDAQDKSTDMWMDWAVWQMEQEWLSIQEHNFWYNRYNRLINGTIPLKDILTGKAIPRGSGILEQIPNKGSFSTLTYNYIANIIGDAFYGQPDAAGRTITLMGGKGFRRDLHRALMAEGATFLQDFGAVADKFVTGTGRELVLGGFFDSFYHIDGYLVKFRENEVFNSGKMAAVSPLHPVTKLPLESHRGVFLDDRDYDGQPNIRHVYQERGGAPFMHGIVKGLTPTPPSIKMLLGGGGSGNTEFNGLLTTDQDKSSYTRLSSGGIQILRANQCFDLECVAGLA